MEAFLFPRKVLLHYKWDKVDKKFGLSLLPFILQVPWLGSWCKIIHFNFTMDFQMPILKQSKVKKQTAEVDNSFFATKHPTI